MQTFDDMTNVAPARDDWKGVHALFEGGDGSAVFVLACPASLDLGQVPPLRERAQEVLNRAVAMVGSALDFDGTVRGFFAQFGIVALRSEHLSAAARAAECRPSN